LGFTVIISSDDFFTLLLHLFLSLLAVVSIGISIFFLSVLCQGDGVLFWVLSFWASLVCPRKSQGRSCLPLNGERRCHVGKRGISGDIARVGVVTMTNEL
jgi:hypothetical protein